MLALVLAAAYTAMVPLTIACLTMAVALGLGTGAVFKLVPEWFPDRVGAVTGVVGAAGGLGGFFPPLVMGIVKSATGGYALGFALMALVALACLVVLRALRVPQTAAAAHLGLTYSAPSSSGPPAAITANSHTRHVDDRPGCRVKASPSRASAAFAAEARRRDVSAARVIPVLPGRGLATGAAAARVRARPGRSPRARREPAPAAPPGCAATGRRAG